MADQTLEPVTKVLPSLTRSNYQTDDDFRQAKNLYSRIWNQRRYKGHQKPIGVTDPVTGIVVCRTCKGLPVSRHDVVPPSKPGRKRGVTLQPRPVHTIDEMKSVYFLQSKLGEPDLLDK
jgi:hypothetical protein